MDRQELDRDTFREVAHDAAAHVAEANGRAERRAHLDIDGAILDIKLGDEVTSFPIAEILAARTLPFIFISGYDEAMLPPEFSDRPLVAKPANLNRIMRIMEKQFRH